MGQESTISYPSGSDSEPVTDSFLRNGFPHLEEGVKICTLVPAGNITRAMLRFSASSRRNCGQTRQPNWAYLADE